MTISLRLNDNDSMLIKKYAELYGITVSDLVRNAVLEHIEDELDLKAYNEAMEKYKADSTTYSLADVDAMFEGEA